ncbi:hypothetical protein RFI_12298 [Reticulomyxa filosa]|uniref:Uncharacterized protein n=1 Tax=Reticulomyxa filosa TaxID=46433 RepID=X6NEV8_RETFI|nr:hypothetical protein RFI_12298 [Reticulomyxa filosa]|eukprot:ETO24860.1 hypothetical protein RFI_12298 [Reticulomyxa filosa]
MMVSGTCQIDEKSSDEVEREEEIVYDECAMKVNSDEEAEWKSFTESDEDVESDLEEMVIELNEESNDNDSSAENKRKKKKKHQKHQTNSKHLRSSSTKPKKRTYNQIHHDNVDTNETNTIGAMNEGDERNNEIPEKQFKRRRVLNTGTACPAYRVIPMEYVIDTPEAQVLSALANGTVPAPQAEARVVMRVRQTRNPLQEAVKALGATKFTMKELILKMEQVLQVRNYYNETSTCKSMVERLHLELIATSGEFILTH